MIIIDNDVKPFLDRLFGQANRHAQPGYGVRGGNGFLRVVSLNISGMNKKTSYE